MRPKWSQKSREERTGARWLVGWLVGGLVGALDGAWWWLGGGLEEGGGFIRDTVGSHLGAPGETREGEQRPKNVSHSLNAPHKEGLADNTVIMFRVVFLFLVYYS